MTSGSRAASDRAVAVRYAEGLPAPMIVASGRGALAVAIRDVAAEAGVAIVEDAPLAEALSVLDPGTLVPPELYEVIAKLLVFVRDIGEK